jgi:hypothetical protein
VGDEKRHPEDADVRDSLTEEAGETTAADMVRGPEDKRPVGAGTRVKVAGDPEPPED